MSERLRAGMREMSQVAAERHVDRVESWASETGARVRRVRRVRGAAAAGAAAALLAGALVTGSALAHRTAPVPPVRPAPAPSEVQTSGILEGWHDAGVDPAIFGEATVTDSVAVDGKVVAVGCDPGAGVQVADPGAAVPAPPIWFGTADGQWRRATVDAPAAYCLHEVVSTPYGLFAAGVPGPAEQATDTTYYRGPLLRSTDGGESWTGVELDPGEAGWVVQVPAVGVLDDRVVAVTTRTTGTSLTVATLWTTTDGDTWTRLGAGDRTRPALGDDPARVFNGAVITDLETVGRHLVAVGAYLGPPAGAQGDVDGRAWVSQDGLEWQHAALPDRDGCPLTDVAGTPTGALAAGWCQWPPLPYLERSADGSAWQRFGQGPSDGFAYLGVQALQPLGDRTLVVGAALDGSSVYATPRQWMVTPDGTWHPVDRLVAPFEVAGGVGFWPRAGTGPTTTVLVEDAR